MWSQIHQAGDLLLRLLLWWGLFLPLGAVASLDAADTTAQPPPTTLTVGGMPVLGLLLQIGSVYFLTVRQQRDFPPASPLPFSLVTYGSDGQQAMVKVDTAWPSGTTSPDEFVSVVI